MKHFDHPNVLHLIGVFPGRRSGSLCGDALYMDNGSLLHYLKKDRNNLVLYLLEWMMMW
jgi:hypothetical protein